MTYTFVDMEESLAELPTLRDVLGKNWIKREKHTSPVESKFPLARTLRIRELRHLVVSLDRRLADLKHAKGADDWRRRLRNNGQETRELLTEISFADLLWRRGYEFEHPDEGPDFVIAIDGGSPLIVEAITPRIIGWDDDLDARLWMLGRQFDYSINKEPAGNEHPILSEKVTERKMQQVVAVALGRLMSATVDRSYIAQVHTDVGLKIEWSPSSNPGFHKRNSPNSSPIRAFDYVWTAAEKKLKQLRDAGAHTLLLGTNQLPFPEWAQYVESVRNNVPFYGKFDWTQIQHQVDRIIVYQATDADNAYPSIEVWERPGKETVPRDPLFPFIQALRMAGEARRRQNAEEESDLVARLMRHEAIQLQAQEPS